MSDEPPIKTVSSKVVYQNPWITVHEDKTLTPSGKDGVYGYMESDDSVITVILDDQQRVYMIRAFRYPSKSWGWELAGGGGEGEDPVIAAKREVEEETGIRVGRIEKIGESLVCNGLMTEKMTIFVAHDLNFDGHQEIGDEALGEMKFFSLAEIDELVDSGEINDGQTITALYYLNRWLTKNKLTELA